MKLGTIVATFTALALSAAIPARRDMDNDQALGDMEMSFSVDATGVDLNIYDAYAFGSVDIQGPPLMGG